MARLTRVTLLLAIVLPAAAQQGPGSPVGDEFSGAGQSSRRCSSGTSNSCKEVQAPTDSWGRCSLSGMQLVQQAGSTCYYCQCTGRIIYSPPRPNSPKSGTS